MRYYSAYRSEMQARHEEDTAMERKRALRLIPTADGHRPWRWATVLVFALSLALLVSCGGDSEDSDAATATKQRRMLSSSSAMAWDRLT